MHKVRDRDEDYWDKYRGTPKGFVSLKAGQEMWGNRWGSSTGMRVDKSDISSEELSIQLRENLKAEDAGLILRNLRSDAEKSVESPVDFGQLFIGFSFFVIFAVLAIAGMLLIFNLNNEENKLVFYGVWGGNLERLKCCFGGKAYRLPL